MKIGIDARFYGPTNTGLGRYTQKLIENLERIDDMNDYVIFLRKDAFALYEPKNPRFQKRVADFHWYGFTEQLLFPLTLWKEKMDLVHFPHFNIPLLYRRPFVMTLHDLILFRFPTEKSSTLPLWLYRLKYSVYKRVIRSAAKRAKKIIAVSQYTKNEIINLLRVPETKIAVVHEACGQESSPETSLPALIQKPYILYVGNAYPHKNLDTLVTAFLEMVNENKMDLRLVLTGKEDFFYTRLKNTLGSNSKSIIFYGYASENELSSLYRNATLYVFPSLLEGFGLPPLEAMRHGLPVVASGTSCLPEILDDAAVYFDPKSVKDIKKVIELVLKDTSLQNDLRHKGYARITLYSWKKAAQETLALYESSHAEKFS